jgi:hypothetical protein
MTWAWAIELALRRTITQLTNKILFTSDSLWRFSRAPVSSKALVE